MAGVLISNCPGQLDGMIIKVINGLPQASLSFPILTTGLSGFEAVKALHQGARRITATAYRKLEAVQIIAEKYMDNDWISEQVNADKEVRISIERV